MKKEEKATEIIFKQQNSRKGTTRQNSQQFTNDGQESRIAFKMLYLITTVLMEFSRGNEEPTGKCYSDFSTSTAKYTESSFKTFDVTKCGAGLNSFTFRAHWKYIGSETRYPKDSKERIYFRYDTKIFIKIQSFGTDQDEEIRVYKMDETPSTLILKAKLEMDHPEQLVYLEVNKENAVLAVRSSYNHIYSNHRNVEYNFSKCYAFR